MTFPKEIADIAFDIINQTAAKPFHTIKCGSRTDVFATNYNEAGKVCDRAILASFNDPRKAEQLASRLNEVWEDYGPNTRRD